MRTSKAINQYYPPQSSRYQRSHFNQIFKLNPQPHAQNASSNNLLWQGRPRLRLVSYLLTDTLSLNIDHCTVLLKQPALVVRSPHSTAHARSLQVRTPSLEHGAHVALVQLVNVPVIEPQVRMSSLRVLCAHAV